MTDENSQDIHWLEETEDALLKEVEKKQAEKDERHVFWCRCPDCKNSKIGIVIK